MPSPAHKKHALQKRYGHAATLTAAENKRDAAAARRAIRELATGEDRMIGGLELEERLRKLLSHD